MTRLFSSAGSNVTSLARPHGCTSCWHADTVTICLALQPPHRNIGTHASRLQIPPNANCWLKLLPRSHRAATLVVMNSQTCVFFWFSLQRGTTNVIMIPMPRLMISSARIIFPAVFVIMVITSSFFRKIAVSTFAPALLVISDTAALCLPLWYESVPKYV